MQSKEDFINQYDGVLSSPTKSTTTTPALNFGGAIFNWTSNQGSALFNFDDDSLKISMIDNRINISTQIRDASGHMIGEIINNHWYIYSSQFILDRNFNSNSLEIKNLKGDITFQILLDGNEVRLAGYYYDKEGSGSFMFIGPWIKNSEPLFLYPSIDHRGKLNQNGTYVNSGAEFERVNK
jgi:hypothetical protein